MGGFMFNLIPILVIGWVKLILKMANDDPDKKKKRDPEEETWASVYTQALRDELVSKIDLIWYGVSFGIVCVITAACAISTSDLSAATEDSYGGASDNYDPTSTDPYGQDTANSKSTKALASGQHSVADVYSLLVVGAAFTFAGVQLLHWMYLRSLLKTCESTNENFKMSRTTHEFSVFIFLYLIAYLSGVNATLTMATIPPTLCVPRERSERQKELAAPTRAA
jgi:hypothetical protein